MNAKLLLQYAGRAGGALIAARLVGDKAGTAGLVASLALGWLAGGLVADKLADQILLGLDLR